MTATKPPRHEETVPVEQLRRDRERFRLLQRSLQLTCSLDALRGWREHADSTLDSAHVLPELAHLTLLTPLQEKTSAPIITWDVHAPEIILGRYNQNIGPVDISFHGLLDYELYTLGSPHIKLVMLDESSWRLIRLAPHAHVMLNERVIDDLHTEHAITSGDVLSLGVVQMRFDVSDNAQAFHAWTQQRKDLLRTQPGAALFLKRHGGICGPRFALKPEHASTIGRSFPHATSLAAPPHWPALTASDWNLSGLPDQERRQIAFRHITIRPIHDQDWELIPLSDRHEVTLNRVAIQDAASLQNGDEIGLGSVLFHFHNPGEQEPSTRHTIKLPNVVDWHSEKSSLIKLPRPTASRHEP